MASFRIFQDQENQGIEVKLGVKDMNQQQKRSVLGVLNKNTSRIQPLKTKDGKSCQEENICINQKVSAIQKTSFKIHEDKVENENLVQRNIKPVSEIVKPKEKDEYKEEIYQYLRQREVRHRPKFGYMKKQPDITYSMRTILVDWLVEVAEEYKLQTETLYLAVSYIDRFLSFMSVVRAKLQLVGTAAMFVAAKYEEIYPPDVGEFVYITDDTYTKKQVLRMEHLLLKVLAFDLSVPTPLSFITSFRVVTNLPETTMFLAMVAQCFSSCPPRSSPLKYLLAAEDFDSLLCLTTMLQNLYATSPILSNSEGKIKLTKQIIFLNFVYFCKLLLCIETKFKLFSLLIQPCKTF
ncbi:G2/mitotic-specific cyclin-A [Blattella germanica]|nr:G2/mitotic-specific cyclin-A [Blattella germanica]